MSTTPAPNPRASLLNGLRTGGVRSTSANVPHTAAPGGSFNVPRFPSQQHSSSTYPVEDETQSTEIPAQNVFLDTSARPMLMTSAVDGSSNRFSQQQQRQIPRSVNPNNMPFSPGYAPRMDQNQLQDQAMQMQMMQFELMRIQALQVQQMMAQAQQVQHQQQRQAQHQQNRRASPAFVPPATAGPSTTSFDLRSASLSAQLRRANQPDHAKSVPVDDQVPMTAALGGKFGSRATNSGSCNGNNYGNDDIMPTTPNSTTVISGGTSLGNLSNNPNNSAPSKSDAAMSWRRGGNNNSVISGNNRVLSSPSVKITPPPGERVSPPPLPAIAKVRPQPLQFNSFVSQPTDLVSVDTEAVDVEDAASSTSSKSAGSNSPTTPPTPNAYPLSPREEASKKLYEGLGLGRPAADSVVQPEIAQVVNHRMVSQPVRQPRGPPSGADELGPKNFARMVRRKAIGGLGMLANARERREFVEAY